jgi:hypothetical protein
MHNQGALYEQIAKQVNEDYSRRNLVIPLVSGRVSGSGGIDDAYDREARMFLDEPLAILQFLKSLPQDVLAGYDEVDDFLHRAVTRAREAEQRSTEPPSVVPQ